MSSEKKTEVEMRKWFITINNYCDLDCTRASKEIKKCLYGRWGKEIGEKNGIPHIHIWLHYKSARKFSKFGKLWPRANIQAGAGEDCDQTYIGKNGHSEEYGVPQAQGMRTDISKIKDLIKSGGKMKDVLNTNCNFQTIRMAELLLKYQELPRRIAPIEVSWHYGKTGTSKTWTVFEKHPNVFMPTTYKWWEGYDAHDVVLIDDFRPDWCSFKQLLQLLDIYPFRVEAKGNSREAKYTKIFITCSKSPTEIWNGYAGDEDIEQLIRRIEDSPGDGIKKFTKQFNKKEKQTGCWI